MDVWSWIVVGVGTLLALRAFLAVQRFRTVLRSRGRRPRYELSDHGEPPYLAPFAELLEAQLTPLGFTPVGMAWGRDATSWSDGWHFLLRHHDGVTWAVVRATALRPMPAILWFVTVHDDGRFAQVTRHGGDWRFGPEDGPWRVKGCYVATWREVFAEHEREVARWVAEGHEASALDTEAFLERLITLEAADWERAVERGWAGPAEEGAYRLTWRAARKAYPQLQEQIAGLRELAQGTLAEAPAPTAELVADLHLGREKHLSQAEPRVFVWGISLASAAAFAIGAALIWDATFVPALLGVLLFHELGHWSAMRLFGYRNARIFFIPFFGAAATGKRTDAKLWQEIVVLLAGPVPGLIVGGILLVIGLDVPWMVEIATLMIALNGLNLLPFFPLDGGRIVHRLLHVDATWLDVGLRALASATFAAGAIAFGDFILGALALFGLMGLPSALRIGRTTRSLRSRGAHALGEEEQLIAIHRELLAQPAFARQSAVARIGVASRIQERLGRPEEPLTVRLPLLSVYGFALGAPIVGGAVLVALSGAIAPLGGEDLALHACGEPAAAPEVPGRVVYRCESMSDALRADLDGAMPRAYCPRHPWDAAPEDPARVERTEEALRELDDAVDAIDVEALGPDPEAWRLARREAVDATVERSGAIDPALAEAYVGLFEGDEDAAALIGARLETGTSCAEGRARLFMVDGDRFAVWHATDDVPPARILDYLCEAGCGAVGAGAMEEGDAVGAPSP